MNFMKVFAAEFLFALCIVCSGVYAETVLRGEVTGKEFDLSGNPYIIDSTITIPKNGKVVFKEGCIVLVNAFSGIDVNGNFIVRGTKKNPVIFTTVNDNRYNPKSEKFPEPLDWNGITFQLASDTAFLENFSLRYSVYGIKSWNNRIVIHNGVFGNNGQYDLVVNDQLQSVAPDLPFSFNYTPPSDDTLSFQAKMKLYERKVQKRKMLTLVTFIGGVAGSGFDGLAWYRYLDYRNNIYPNAQGRTNIDDARTKRDVWKKTAIIAAPCGGTILLASLALFVIPVGGAPVAATKELSRIEILPTFDRPGLVLSIPIR